MIRISKIAAGLLIITLAAAVITGGLLPYYLFFILLTASGLTFLYTMFGYINLKVIYDYEERVYFAGDTEEFKVLAACDVPIPYVHISGRVLNMSADTANIFKGSITFDENILLHNRITFYQRGIYNLGQLNLILGDVFSIWHIREQVKEHISIKVYPRMYEINTLSLIAKDIYLEKNDMYSNNTDPFTIKDIRKYRPYDSLKKIHWKVSAKNRGLYVKNNETISGEDIALFVDMHENNYSYDPRGVMEEKVIDCALSFIRYLTGNAIDVNVFLNAFKDHYFEITDTSSYEHCTEFIVSQKSDGKRSFPEYIESHLYRCNTMNRIFLFTPEITASLAEKAAEIGKSGFSVHILYEVPAEDRIINTLKNHSVIPVPFNRLLKIEE